MNEIKVKSSDKYVFIEDKVQDECGVYAEYSSSISHDIKYNTYYGLYALQHRGQENAGMAIATTAGIECYKRDGLVSKVFREEVLESLPQGDIVLGHVRAGTVGFLDVINAQPMTYNGRYGDFAIAMNGKITNYLKLREKERANGVMFQTFSDVELIANLINKYSTPDNIVVGIQKAVEQLEGSFAMVVMTTNSLIAIRDRFGLRPLVLGKRDQDYCIASESCAFDITEADLIRDIEPGEIVQINGRGLESYYMKKRDKRPCIFEYVYTARPDSIIDKKSVYQARYQCGMKLAQKLKIEADIVAGVPDSAVVAARGYAKGANLPYIDVLEKNRYVGRTFIQPHQLMRENSVKIKLNALRANVDGKRVILVDDSIVRGTTSRNLIKMIRRYGAKEVHLVIASPVVKNPCYTGVDIESRDQLIGVQMSVDEICQYIGADSLHYMEINDLINCCKVDAKDKFCAACFDGKYPDNVEEKIMKQREEGYGY